MLRGIKNADKKLYKIEPKGKGYYKVTEKSTRIYRVMSEAKLNSIFGSVEVENTSPELEQDIDLNELIEKIDLDSLKSSDLSDAEKKAINEKCVELEINVISYKDKLKKLIEYVEGDEEEESEEDNNNN